MERQILFTHISILGAAMALHRKKANPVALSIWSASGPQNALLISSLWFHYRCKYLLTGMTTFQRAAMLMATSLVLCTLAGTTFACKNGTPPPPGKSCCGDAIVSGTGSSNGMECCSGECLFWKATLADPFAFIHLSFHACVIDQGPD